MARTRLIIFAVLFIDLLLLGLGSFYFQDQYLILSFVFVISALVPFLVRFEARKMEGREVVLIAILAAIAAVSRIPFAPIPSVQPTSFIIMMTAYVFGAETGFMVGALAALVSNMFLGQGPWTPWQMLAWGMIGFSTGMLKDTWLMKKMIGKILFGFLWGFLFGWMMNVTFIFSFLDDFSWSILLTTYMASVLFDFMHAISNVVFLLLFSTAWIKILERFKRKYGLLSMR
ncbi:ECF transporter S component [Ammoniphilus sp. CFH 90114]|uniref:ECF transporter S component n=1 Tax=Ammoniphilus sp. CFH 90114 TaxID=2493665 RepID=UPI0026C42A48